MASSEEELAVIPSATKRKGWGSLPFGPFLVLATLEFMLPGRVIVDTYLAYLWVM
jgi:hypothetical protein